MKKADGYVTEDGIFFTKMEHAVYYEARTALVAVLDNTEIDEGRYVDPEKFIEVLTLVHPQVEKFINGYKADPEYAQEFEAAAAAKRHRSSVPDKGENPVQGNGKEIGQSRPYRGTRESPPGVQQFAAGGYEPVPNVGSRKQSEELQDDSEEFSP